MPVSPDSNSEPRRAQRESVPLPTGAAILVRSVVNTHFDYPWHYHPEAELMLVLEGHGVRYVGDSIREFGPGDLCLVAGGTPHCWSSEAEPGRMVRALVVQFPHDVFGADFLSLEATRAISSLLERAKLGIRLDGATRNKVERELLRLADAELTDLEKLVQLLGILTTIAMSSDVQCLSLASVAPPVSPRDLTRTDKLLQYIHGHVSQRLSQSDTAKLVGMSPGAFSRFFSRQFGKPFVSYMAELRVGHACRLLADSDLNVSEVAFRVGFNNLANFNRHFLRLKGMTPTAYRRKLRAVARSTRAEEVFLTQDIELPPESGFGCPPLGELQDLAGAA
jgi:AraC-like DNA-binding protein/quercetin dioxygenase-like cupin family protein